MEFANQALGPLTPRLCWSCRRKDDPIDAHSKWIEAICTPNATSAAVIEELRPLLAQFGIPKTVVTNNGTYFVSAEFDTFLKSNDIKHLTSAPYHPASNGLAERACTDSQERIEKDHSW